MIHCFPFAFKLAGLVETAHNRCRGEPFFAQANRPIVGIRVFGLLKQAPCKSANNSAKTTNSGVGKPDLVADQNPQYKITFKI